MGLLDGKRALVMGVGNKRSIAWGIATAFQREGADLAFNWPNERLKDNVLELVLVNLSLVLTQTTQWMWCSTALASNLPNLERLAHISRAVDSAK